ncbi:unnamed protein product [Lactuca saligna]|uniref:Uncharacterized protein n=1 Tax=Lactuca saligna TaxID=75948 RepID=A0AA35ZEF6_LACSI|nr:unnamed protein product [Lactuca saligna]
MYACMSEASYVIQEYKKHPSSGPRELTPAMVRSIEEADKPPKRGKKSDTQKEKNVAKSTKKKPARRLILQPTSDSDSEYVPPLTKPSTHSDSESESSDDEALAAQKKSQTVNTSVDNLHRSLQAERSNLEAAR